MLCMSTTYAAPMATKWDKKRAARYLKARREQLRLSQEELAVRARISRSTVLNIENMHKESYRRDNLRDLSVALGWTPDSLHVVGEGGEPEEAEGGVNASGPLGEILQGLNELRDGIDTLKQMYGDQEIRLHQVEQRDRAPRR